MQRIIDIPEMSLRQFENNMQGSFQYILPTKKEQGWHRVRLLFVELDWDLDEEGATSNVSPNPEQCFEIKCNGAVVENQINVYDLCNSDRSDIVPITVPCHQVYFYNNNGEIDKFPENKGYLCVIFI